MERGRRIYLGGWLPKAFANKWAVYIYIFAVDVEIYVEFLESDGEPSLNSKWCAGSLVFARCLPRLLALPSVH